MQTDKPPELRRWSEERREYLRETWTAVVPKTEIFAGLNAMPGPPITNEMISSYANGTMGLRRPEGIHAFNRLSAIDKLNAYRNMAQLSSAETRRKKKEQEEQQRVANWQRAQEAEPKPREPRPSYRRTEPFSMEAMSGPDPRVQLFREQAERRRHGRLEDGYAHPITHLIKD